jgi:uncharacterized membrane protein YfcA
MNAETELWLFAVSVGASALGGMLGMASGIFIVPILTIFGHVDIRSAIGASIVSVIACSCSSAAPFLKARLTNVRLAIALETATTAGGTWLAGLSASLFVRYVSQRICSSLTPRIQTLLKPTVCLLLMTRCTRP